MREDTSRGQRWYSSPIRSVDFSRLVPFIYMTPQRERNTWIMFCCLWVPLMSSILQATSEARGQVCPLIWLANGSYLGRMCKLRECLEEKWRMMSLSPLHIPIRKKKVIDICSFWVGKLEFKGHRGFYKSIQVITIYLFSPFYKSILWSFYRKVSKGYGDHKCEAGEQEWRSGSVRRAGWISSTLWSSCSGS